MQQPCTAISVVLPVYNEASNIGPLIRALARVFESVIRQPYEIIVVDDASTDGSAAVAMEAARGNADAGRAAPVTVLSRHPREGQSAALMRGMEAAAGQIIVTMDADLQHDPAELPQLLAALAGHTMVCGVRKNRDDGILRKWCSRIANTFRNLVTRDTTADSGCTYRVMRRECIPLLQSLKGRLLGCEFFFHPVLLRRQGFAVREWPITHRARKAGKSRYPLVRGRMISGIRACFIARTILKKSAGDR